MSTQPIRLSGTAYECGLAHGQAAKAAIARAIPIYEQLFQFHAQLSPKDARREAERYLPPLRQHLPDLVEEMQGIADGSGRDLPEILMLNCRTELLSTASMQECTSVAGLPPATRSGQVLLGQTWDWLEVTADLVVLLDIHREDRPRILTLAEAGQVGKLGLNAEGIGLCLNWLEADHKAIGVPVHALCRALLGASTLVEALDLLYQLPRAAAANYLLASAEGFAVNLETLPGDIEFQDPEQGLLIHSNYFQAARFRPHDRGLRSGGANSILRRQQAERQLRNATQPLDLPQLQQLQRQPPICQMPDPNSPPLDRWATLAGVIMDLTDKTLHLTLNPGPQADYFQVQL